MLGSAGRAPGTDGSCGFPIRFEIAFRFSIPSNLTGIPSPKQHSSRGLSFMDCFCIRRRVAPEYCS